MPVANTDQMTEPTKNSRKNAQGNWTNTTKLRTHSKLSSGFECTVRVKQTTTTKKTNKNFKKYIF